MEIHYAIGGAGEPVFLLHGPHYADPISCPVLAVGAQGHLGDEVSKQLAQVARNGVRQFLDIGTGLPTANNTR